LIQVDGSEHAVVHEWFEDGLRPLSDRLRPGPHLVCCLMCWTW
jgi:hypothetical protein